MSQGTLEGETMATEGKLDASRVRKDFPILDQLVHGKPLVYLDNAATTQKPQRVIDAVSRFNQRDNANVHRGVHQLSQRATDAYEGARDTVRRFLGAADTKEIIFTRGTTEAINLVAQTYGRKHVQEGDEVLITQMEHHSNIVPWQLLCEEKGAKLRYVPINDRGELDLDKLDDLLTDRTRIVSVVHVSNALGTVNPVREIIQRAHAKGIPVLVDGAQAAPHVEVDVQALDADWYAFSGHKVYGPTGIGVLYGKQALLEDMPPYQGGGDMIRRVSLEKSTWNDLPYKFEAGTPNISGVIGLGEALAYVQDLGMATIAAHERDLVAYATEKLAELEHVTLIGTAREKAGVVSFTVENAHPHDVGTMVDHEGVAIRAGHHCAQPVMQHFNVPATSRASFGIYNTREDVDRLVDAVRQVSEVWN